MIVLTIEFLIITAICCIAILVASKTNIIKNARRKNITIYLLVGVIALSFIVSNLSADLYNDKTLRSTQGAIFHMNVCRGNLVDFITLLKRKDYKIYATSLKDAKGLSEFKNEEKIVLIFGNEGRGVRQELLEMADDRIFIEMNRFESLNVAMAATICCYWFRS